MNLQCADNDYVPGARWTASVVQRLLSAAERLFSCLPTLADQRQKMAELCRGLGKEFYWSDHSAAAVPFRADVHFPARPTMR